MSPLQADRPAAASPAAAPAPNPPPATATPRLSPTELAALTRRSNWRGGLALLGVWAGIAACLLLAALWPHPLTLLLAVVLLGGRQLALAVLAHEAAHRTLFAHRGLNEFAGDWLGARPIWQSLPKYRAHHVRHHRHVGSAQDPDLGLHAAYPATRASMLRKLARDLSGLTGLKLAFGLTLMDAGVYRYTVSTDIEKLPQQGRRWWHYLRDFGRNAGPMVLCNIALYALLSAVGIGWTYALWVAAWFTTFPLYVRIRSLAEHSMCEPGPDIARNTRSTRAGWLARMLVAPMQVNYHREHHLWAAVPCYRLPQVHRILRARGYEAPLPSYWQVLRQAASG